MSSPKSLEYELLLQEQIEDMNRRLFNKLKGTVKGLVTLPKGRLKTIFMNDEYILIELAYSGFYVESSFIDVRFEEFNKRVLVSEDRLFYILNTLSEEVSLAF